MIFNIIKYGTFTADDFINAHGFNDYIKFTSLPIDLRKKFISDAIDLHPNKEGNNFKQAAFDFLDGKITEDQFRDAYWKYRVANCRQHPAPATGVAVAWATAAAMAAVPAVVAVAYYHPYLEQHAKLLNKLIKEYE